MAGKNIFILAAGNNKYSDKPCSLWSFGNGKSILYWQTHTIESALPGKEVKIAVGYDYHKIIEDHLDHTFLYDGRAFKQMYMISFLQLLIDAGWMVMAGLKLTLLKIFSFMSAYQQKES